MIGFGKFVVIFGMMSHREAGRRFHNFHTRAGRKAETRYYRSNDRFD